MSKAANEPTEVSMPQTMASRRSVLGVGVAAVSASVGLMPSRAVAETACAPGEGASAPEDGTVKAFGDSLEAAPTRKDFTSPGGITGAQIFANLCKDENLAALFMCSGNYTITHEIAQVGVPTFGGHNEGGMAFAADGYAACQRSRHRVFGYRRSRLHQHAYGDRHRPFRQYAAAGARQ